MQEEIPKFYVACEGIAESVREASISCRETDENPLDCTGISDSFKITDDDEIQRRQKINVLPFKNCTEKNVSGLMKMFCSSSIICSENRNYNVQKWFAEKQQRPNLATIEMAL